MYLAIVRIIILGYLLLGLVQSGLTQVKNPFDLLRKDTMETASAPATTESELSFDTKLDDENPFSVSHIPIRKNQYKEIPS